MESRRCETSIVRREARGVSTFAQQTIATAGFTIDASRLTPHVSRLTIMTNTTKLVICIVLTTGIGLLGGIFTAPEIQTWFVQLQKPSWNPPNWLFGLSSIL